MMYKKGDKLICVRNALVESELTIGGVYVVASNCTNDSLVTIENGFMKHRVFSTRRFVFAYAVLFEDT